MYVCVRKRRREEEQEEEELLEQGKVASQAVYYMKEQVRYECTVLYCYVHGI